MLANDDARRWNRRAENRKNLWRPLAPLFIDQIPPLTRHRHRDPMKNTEIVRVREKIQHPRRWLRSARDVAWEDERANNPEIEI